MRSVIRKSVITPCRMGRTAIILPGVRPIIKTADYIIDIGPEGGDGGGTVIACGTPEEVAKSPVSYTGKYVEKYL